MLRYIQAATSPKDIIIMVDISGSMKGLKMTIAKHTINTILDTLGENDFVNIIAVRHTHTHTFSDCLHYRHPGLLLVSSTQTTFAMWSPVSKERWSRPT